MVLAARQGVGCRLAGGLAAGLHFVKIVMIRTIIIIIRIIILRINNTTNIIIIIRIIIIILIESND